MVERPLIVVAGPTASGKTALALRLAEELGGEIVSCDSVSVYRGMDIGSAKPTAEEREHVRHHCLDLYEINEACTAGDYARHAREALAGISDRGLVPIVAGGTGLYLRALLEGLAPAPQRDEALRERLRAEAEAHPPGYLLGLLQQMDAKAAGMIHANDTPKLIRSIEVTLAAKQPQTEQWEAGREALEGYRVLKLGINPDRARLHARINARAAAMFNRGLLAETDALRAQFGEDCRPLTSLGYAQAMQVLKQEATLEEAVTAAQAGHRQYAKRQLTWFRADKEMHWLEGCGDDGGLQTEALALAQKFMTLAALS